MQEYKELAEAHGSYTNYATGEVLDGYYLIPFMDKDNKITYYTAEAVHRGEKVSDEFSIPKYRKLKKDYVGDAPIFNERYLHQNEPYIFITERLIRRFKYWSSRI